MLLEAGAMVGKAKTAHNVGNTERRDVVSHEHVPATLVLLTGW